MLRKFPFWNEKPLGRSLAFVGGQGTPQLAVTRFVNPKSPEPVCPWKVMIEWWLRVNQNDYFTYRTGLSRNTMLSTENILEMEIYTDNITNNSWRERAIAIVLCWPPELDNRTLLLRIPHTSVMPRNRAGTAQKAFSYWLALIVPEVSRQVDRNLWTWEL